MPIKNPACTLGPKHTWAFVRNGARASGTAGSFGGRMSFAVRGLYRCECGVTRVGKVNPNAPGADLRDHI